MRKYQTDNLTTVLVISGQESRRLSAANEFIKAKGFPIWMDAVYLKNNSPQNGIAAAHKRCVKVAKQQDWPYVIIAEDDVVFSSPDSIKHFVESMANLPLDWDIFLGGIYGSKTFNHDYENIYRVTDASGFHFYAVNNRFYETFLKVEKNHNIDRWTTSMNYGKANAFCIYPYVAYQANGFSENVGREVDYTFLLKDKQFYGKQ